MEQLLLLMHKEQIKETRPLLVRREPKMIPKLSIPISTTTRRRMDITLTTPILLLLPGHITALSRLITAYQRPLLPFQLQLKKERTLQRTRKGKILRNR